LLGDATAHRLPLKSNCRCCSNKYYVIKGPVSSTNFHIPPHKTSAFSASASFKLQLLETVRPTLSFLSMKWWQRIDYFSRGHVSLGEARCTDASLTKNVNDDDISSKIFLIAITQTSCHQHPVTNFLVDYSWQTLQRLTFMQPRTGPL
jgi:hypothetical protein